MNIKMKDWFDEAQINPVKGLFNVPQLVATLFFVPAIVIGVDANGFAALAYPALPFATVTAPLIATLLLWGLQLPLLFAFASDFQWTLRREEWKGGWFGGTCAFAVSLVATWFLMSKGVHVAQQAWSLVVGFVTYCTQSYVAAAVAVPACLFAAVYVTLRIGQPVLEMHEKAKEEAERRKKQ